MCSRVWRAPRAVQTAAASPGGIAAPSFLENHGFQWFQSGVRVASRRASRRPEITLDRYAAFFMFLDAQAAILFLILPCLSCRSTAPTFLDTQATISFFIHRPFRLSPITSRELSISPVRVRPTLTHRVPNSSTRCKLTARTPQPVGRFL